MLLAFGSFQSILLPCATGVEPSKELADEKAQEEVAVDETNENETNEVKASEAWNRFESRDRFHSLPCNMFTLRRLNHLQRCILVSWEIS